MFAKKETDTKTRLAEAKVYWLAEEDIEKMKPVRRDVDAAVKKGLQKDGCWTQLYRNAFSVYSFVLHKYLGGLLGWEALENRIREECSIRPVPDTERDLFAFLSPYDFLYIRNSLYPENLPVKTLYAFLDAWNENDEAAVRKIVEETWPYVIKPFESDRGTFFGPNTKPYMVSYDELVIGCRLDGPVKRTLFGRPDEEPLREWRLHRLPELASSEWQKLLPCECRLIDYEKNVVSGILTPEDIRKLRERPYTAAGERPAKGESAEERSAEKETAPAQTGKDTAAGFDKNVPLYWKRWPKDPETLQSFRSAFANRKNTYYRFEYGAIGMRNAGNHLTYQLTPFHTWELNMHIEDWVIDAQYSYDELPKTEPMREKCLTLWERHFEGEIDKHLRTGNGN